MPRKPKHKTLEEHTKRRLAERYGLKYTQLLHDTLLYNLRNGKAQLVQKQSLRVTVFDSVYEVRETDIDDHAKAKPGQVRIRFAYDRNRKTLITVLAPDMHPADLGEGDIDEL